MKQYLKGFSRIKGGVLTPPSSPPSTPPRSSQEQKPPTISPVAGYKRKRPIKPGNFKAITDLYNKLKRQEPYFEGQIYNRDLSQSARHNMFMYSKNIDSIGDAIEVILNADSSTDIMNSISKYLNYLNDDVVNPFIPIDEWEDGVFKEYLTDY